MQHFWKIITDAYSGYAGYLWQEITFSYNYKPWYQNYFYWLILVSVFFWALEWAKPWRVGQAKFRKDFWLDFFYMFFNFFLFSLIIYNAASSIIVDFFNRSVFQLTHFDLQASNPLQKAPYWLILLVGFVVRDFTQWWTHRLLHRVPRLWEFHKVHHSVKEMGFAAHLRYHWMETIVYRSIEYLPLAWLGIGLYDFFIIHIFTLAVGHFNHSNITVSGQVKGGIFGVLLGWVIATRSFEVNLLPPDAGILLQLATVVGAGVIGFLLLGRLMKFIFNSPEMHIWHHAKNLPADIPYGINFGITLSIWDYLFRTDYIPHEGRDIELGFVDEKNFPQTFWGQVKHGF